MSRPWALDGQGARQALLNAAAANPQTLRAATCVPLFSLRPASVDDGSLSAQAAGMGAVRALLRTTLFYMGVACSAAENARQGAAPEDNLQHWKEEPGLRLPTPLPPAIDARLDELARQLGELACQRAQKCCPLFELIPVRNCAGPSLLVLNARGRRVPPDRQHEFDIWIDERYAEVCLEVARELTSDCEFADANLFYEWVAPCEHVLQVVETGEPAEECFGDESDNELCRRVFGEGYSCREHRCYPETLISTGESCELVEPVTSLPVCDSTDSCRLSGSTSDDSLTCLPRSLSGDACSVRDSCQAGHYCDLSSSICLEKKPTDATCLVDDECIEGQCHQSVCVHYPQINDACQTDEDCNGVTLRCLTGRCVPRQMGLCEPPAP